VSLRLFVALDIPEAVRRSLAGLMMQLRPAAPGARWVRAESMHLTLKFIGHVPPEKLEPIREALSAVRLEAPVEIRFSGVGFFPSERRPRVLWAGMEATPNLAELASSLEARLEPLGIAKEQRDFKPHLTLARFSEPWPARKLLDAVRSLPNREFGEMRASEFHLFESHLKRSGAEYTVLATFRFAG
jgi:2'-5' RNA ligase